MEYFDRFAWAVPWAFHDALNLCRFERGDILYDNAAAYGPDWSRALDIIDGTLQVRFPEQIPNPPDLDGGSVFTANWHSEIRVDVFRRMERVQSDVVSTQGRLYTALWRGDLAILDLDTAEPRPPVGWKGLRKVLLGTEDAINRRWPNEVVFVLAHDLVSPLTQEKLRTITARLRTNLVKEPVLLSPADAGVHDPGDVAPTVYVAALPVRGLSQAQLIEEVKAAFYRPNPAAKKPKFRLSAHGAVF